MRQGKPKTIGKITGKTYCFTAGTPVLLPDGMKPIEEIRKGDWVWSVAPETGDPELKQVEDVFVNETDEIVHVRYGDTEIDATPNHPFYVAEKGWVSAVNLRAGDRLQLVNGEYVTVEQVQHEILESPVKVYNFEVQDNHTYYVGGDDDDSAVLVHNVCSHKNTKTLWNIKKNHQGTKVFSFQSKKIMAYLDKHGYYWTKDLAGHGKSAYKVFRKGEKALNWVADADEFGNFIINKHKGPTGRKIKL